jgi:hypothetical protein
MSGLQKQIERGDVWRFKFAISAIVIAFILGITLRKLIDFQENLERKNIEKQVYFLKLSLSEAWISRNINHKSTNITEFENTNPMLLIAEVPKNYIGELNEQPINEKSVWFYNKKTKRLIYVFTNGDLEEYTLIKKSITSNKTTIPTGGLDLVLAKKI